MVDDDDDDVEMEQKETTNKPLKRRKKTKTPSPTKNESTADSPGISKNIKNLTCDIDNDMDKTKDIINISSDSSQGADDKNDTMNNSKYSDSKPLPRLNKNMNGHQNKTKAKPASTQKKAGRKRKLDEISKDTTTDKNTANTSSDPPKKKRKFYPGFKRNDAPPLHGQTDIPTGKPYCLNGKRFVITGQLPSLTRDEAKDLIQQYGGRYVQIYYIIYAHPCTQCMMI